MNFICVINVSSKGACASRLPPQKLTKYYHFHNLRVCWVLYAPAGSRGYAPKHSIFFSAVCHLGPILRLLSSLNFSIILCVHPSLHACTKNNLEEKERFFIANQETANKPEIIPKPKHCISVTNLTKHCSLGHAHWKSSIHTSTSAVGFQIGMHPFMTVFAVMAKTRTEKLDLHPAKAMITRCQLKHPTWHADINNEVPLLPWNTLEWWFLGEDVGDLWPMYFASSVWSCVEYNHKRLSRSAERKWQHPVNFMRLKYTPPTCPCVRRNARETVKHLIPPPYNNKQQRQSTACLSGHSLSAISQATLGLTSCPISFVMQHDYCCTTNSFSDMGACRSCDLSNVFHSERERERVWTTGDRWLVYFIVLFATLCQRNVCMGQLGISTDARFSSQQKTTWAFRSVGSSARPACGCAVIRFQSSLSHETLGTCTWLCPADCIQARITHKERSTSHFTLEEVGWFSDMSAQTAWIFLACGK